ncbi:unnamed protein product [Lampetra fluviatilis]
MRGVHPSVHHNTTSALLAGLEIVARRAGERGLCGPPGQMHGRGRYCVRICWDPRIGPSLTPGALSVVLISHQTSRPSF